MDIHLLRPFSAADCFGRNPLKGRNTTKIDLLNDTTLQSFGFS